MGNRTCVTGCARLALPAMRYALALTALCLGACTTSGDMLQAGWPKLKGQPLQSAIDRWGYPEQEQVIAGAKVYTWRSSSPFIAEAPAQRTTVTPYGTASSYGSAPVATTIGCTIKLSTNEAGIIQTMQYQGENMGCYRYASALER